MKEIEAMEKNHDKMIETVFKKEDMSIMQMIYAKLHNLQPDSISSQSKDSHS